MFFSNHFIVNNYICQLTDYKLNNTIALLCDCITQ